MNVSEASRVMGLTWRVTEDELKVVYKKLSLKLHPDVNKALDATEQFQSLQEAYAFLRKNLHLLPVQSKKEDEPPPKPKPVYEPKTLYYKLNDSSSEHVIRIPNSLMRDYRLNHDLTINMDWGGRNLTMQFERGTSSFPFVRYFPHFQVKVHVLTETFSAVYFRDLGRDPPAGILLTKEKGSAPTDPLWF